MKPCKVPAGDDPAADAYNLVYCAWVALYQPERQRDAERMAGLISDKITDWEQVGGNLALMAAMGTNFADMAFSDRPEVPSEAMRSGIEANNLIPA